MRKLVGVVTALEQEAQPFIEMIDASEYQPALNNEQKFYIGDYQGTDFVIAVTQPGKIRAASGTQKLICQTSEIDHILHLGVAGGLNDILSTGDIVIPGKIIQ